MVTITLQFLKLLLLKLYFILPEQFVILHYTGRAWYGLGHLESMRAWSPVSRGGCGWTTRSSPVSDFFLPLFT